MMNEAEQLLAAALALPHGERAALADALVRSLDEASSHVEAMDSAIEAAWAEEIRRRVEDLESGRAVTVSWETVHQELLDSIHRS